LQLDDRVTVEVNERVKLYVAVEVNDVGDVNVDINDQLLAENL